MARVEINQSGTKIYRKRNGEFHREDGPAIITQSGHMNWYIDDVLQSSFSRNGNWDSYGQNAFHKSPNGFMKHYDYIGNVIWPKL